MKRTVLVDGHRLPEEVVVSGKDEHDHQKRLLQVQLRSALAEMEGLAILPELMKAVLVEDS